MVPLSPVLPIVPTYSAIWKRDKVAVLGKRVLRTAESKTDIRVGGLILLDSKIALCNRVRQTTTRYTNFFCDTSDNSRLCSRFAQIWFVVLLFGRWYKSLTLFLKQVFWVFCAWIFHCLCLPVLRINMLFSAVFTAACLSLALASSVNFDDCSHFLHRDSEELRHTVKVSQAR